jgi:hypothetical protein
MKSDAYTPWLIICVAVAVAMLRLSIVVADAIVLSIVYGAAVSRGSLRIVGRRPELLVSNGDVLHGWGFRDYSIAVGLWIITSVLLLLLCWHVLLPGPFREAMGRVHARTTGLGLLWVLSLFFLGAGVLPLREALLFDGLSFIAALWWAWRLRPTSIRM